MLNPKERRILHGIYPSVLIPLIRGGHLSAEHLGDLEAARAIIAKRVRFATNRMKWNIAIEQAFAAEAKSAWVQRNAEVSIVLLATAIEQCLNSCLRLIIESKGYRSNQVTELLRAHNVEPKMTWLFEMHTGKSLPKALRSKAKKIFEIRNSIVHYKAVFAHPDSGEDSHSKITKEIAALGRFRPGTFFTRFHDHCWTVVGTCDPSIRLALQLRDKLMPYEDEG